MPNRDLKVRSTFFVQQDGCISAADIDETYCLSFVMPNCTLHLGPLGPADRYARENEGELVPYLEGNGQHLLYYWLKNAALE